MPIISIVLPSYNGEKFICDAIDSIINQSIIDWELIIINDGSTDATGRIANEYAIKDKRIRVIDNKTNMKLPESLNIGFRKSIGEFLTWTSDDNIFMPHALEHMVDYLCMHPEYPMVCADMDTYDIESGERGHFAEYDPQIMYVADAVGACFLYRREVLQAIGEYDTSLFCAEDYDYWIRVLRHFGRIGHLNETLYIYRYHSGTLTDTKLSLVRKRTSQLLWKHKDWVLSGISEDENLTIQFYYQMLRGGNLTHEVKEIVFEFIPELEGNMVSDQSCSWIVFGAGKIGSSVYDRFKDRVKFFSDSNPSLWGKKKEGIIILSLEEMADKASEYQVIVAAGTSKQPSMIRTLYKLGIKKYTTFETLLHYYDDI